MCKFLRIGLLMVAALLAAASFIWGRAAWIAYRDVHPIVREPIDPEHGRALGLRDVSFGTEDGLTLQGWYGEPRNGATVILVHGSGASREQMLPQAAVLARHGFGLLLFDLRACGRSEGSKSTSGELEQMDVAAALAFLRDRGGHPSAKIGAVGFSSGGMALVTVAARSPAIEAVVLEATPPTLEDDIAQDYPADRPLERQVGLLVHRLLGAHPGAFRPVDSLCAISPRPLMLVYGERDPGFSAAVGRRMLGAACDPKVLWVVPGAGHGSFPEAAPGEFEERLVRFFSGALLPPR